MPNYVTPSNLGYGTTNLSMAPQAPSASTNPYLPSNWYTAQASSATGAGTTPVPTPQQGNGPFGLVPGPITVPNPAGDLASQYPNLGGTNAQLSSDIYDKLSGVLSPSTLNSIQNHFGGTFGVVSGMPGSGLSWNNVYGNIIGASENQKQQGIQDYTNAIPAVSGTQTVSPALQTQIQEINAINKAAPNPQAAQTYAQQLFNGYLAATRGPAGGTGGRGSFDPSGGMGMNWGLSQNPTQALGFGPTGQVGAPAGGGGSFSLSSGDLTNGFDPTQDLSNWGSDLSGSQPGVQDYQNFLSGFGGGF